MRHGISCAALQLSRVCLLFVLVVCCLSQPPHAPITPDLKSSCDHRSRVFLLVSRFQTVATALLLALWFHISILSQRFYVSLLLVFPYCCLCYVLCPFVSLNCVVIVAT